MNFTMKYARKRVLNEVTFLAEVGEAISLAVNQIQKKSCKVF
jgi:hypothetical protein